MFVLFYIQLFRCKYVIKRSVQFSFYRDLEIWVIGHSRSFKVMPFKSLGTVFYSPSIVTMAVSVAVCETFSVKEWCDLENRVRVCSRSLEMAPFDRSHTSSYSPSICRIFSHFVSNVIDTLAVDEWAVAFGTAKRGLGEHQQPVYQLHIIRRGTKIAFAL